jgi:hypothetical protein
MAFAISSVFASLLQGSRRTIFISDSSFSFSAMIVFVDLSKYSFTLVNFYICRFFRFFIYFTNWFLLLFTLFAETLEIPLVLLLFATFAVFLADLDVPLNFLFFCLAEVLTLGIVVSKKYNKYFI